MTAPWPVVALGECCDIISGATPKTSDESMWGGDIGWITPKDVSELRGKHVSDTPRKLTEKGLRSCSAAVLPPGSVLLSSRAPIGLLAINTVPMATNQGFKSFIPDPALLDAGYLYRWLDSSRLFLQSLGRGATFKEISKAITAAIKIPLPPIEEQRRIAAVLDRADDLRAKRRASLALLESLTEAIFLDMFGEFATLGDRWPVHSLHECTMSINDCPHSTPVWTETGVVCLRTSNLGLGRWSWKERRYVSEGTYRLRSRRAELVPGDVVLSREGTVGIAAIVPPGLRMCMGQRLVQVRPDAGRVQGDILLQFLLMALAPERIGQTMVGSTAQHLNVRELRALKVPIPPLGLQNNFSRSVARARAIEATQERSSRALDESFISLQHRAFAGQL